MSYSGINFDINALFLLWNIVLMVVGAAYYLRRFWRREVDVQKLNATALNDDEPATDDIASTPPVFGIGEEVIHVKSGNKYVILGLPSRFAIESTGEPAYAYFSTDTRRIWIRSQKLMEDGRFISNNWMNSQYPWWTHDRRSRQVTVQNDRRSDE